MSESWLASPRRSGDGADFRCALDAGPYAHIRVTTAQVSAHRGVDLRVRRMRGSFEQRGGRHDLSALAITALRNVELTPGLLQRMLRAGIEALDGRDFRRS